MHGVERLRLPSRHQGSNHLPGVFRVRVVLFIHGAIIAAKPGDAQTGTLPACPLGAARSAWLPRREVMERLGAGASPLA